MNFALKDNIIYEDDNLLVIDKPRGLLLQQDGSDNPSLDKIVGDYLNMIAMPVHRLDKDTSGLVLFAKNKKKSVKKLHFLLFQITLII